MNELIKNNIKSKTGHKSEVIHFHCGGPDPQGENQRGYSGIHLQSGHEAQPLRESRH